MPRTRVDRFNGPATSPAAGKRSPMANYRAEDIQRTRRSPVVAVHTTNPNNTRRASCEHTSHHGAYLI